MISGLKSQTFIYCMSENQSIEIMGQKLHWFTFCWKTKRLQGTARGTMLLGMSLPRKFSAQWLTAPLSWPRPTNLSFLCRASWPSVYIPWWWRCCLMRGWRGFELRRKQNCFHVQNPENCFCVEKSRDLHSLCCHCIYQVGHGLHASWNLHTSWIIIFFLEYLISSCPT